MQLGPLFYNLQCVHPDTAKDVLKNGKTCCEYNI